MTVKGVRVVNVTDEATFALLPPCADPRFDHRTCDYWEDVDRGSKASRPGRPTPETPSATPRATTPAVPYNPFAPDPGVATPAFNPFLAEGADPLAGNPFAPGRPAAPAVPAGGPRKLGLLGRGLAVFGSYAKVLLVDDEPAGYAQFGPLSAYPRALRLRELYPQLPDAPLPAVITCVATTRAARGTGLARRLVETVCADLAERGFAAVEAYPEAGAAPDATSAATPDFWVAVGFSIAVADERFPVVRREL